MLKQNARRLFGDIDRDCDDRGKTLELGRYGDAVGIIGADTVKWEDSGCVFAWCDGIESRSPQMIEALYQAW